MIIAKNFENPEIKEIIKNGGVGVIPTDTLYGVVGSAFSASLVEKIYSLKKRDASKPLIVIISDFSDLQKFEITLQGETESILKTLWPGPVSVILPISSEKFSYLHRGKGSIAFRLPKDDELRKFIRDVGPIVAPSANPEGNEPARNVEEIKNYFGESIDFIVDGGELSGEPSALVQIENGKLLFLRGNNTIKK